MFADVLIAEIGSTTTLVSAFSLGNSPRVLGQGQAATSVLEGDVRVGLNRAIDALKEHLGVRELTYGELLASSGAAGGRRSGVL